MTKTVPIPIDGRIMGESVVADKIIYYYLKYDQNTLGTDYNLYNNGQPQFVMRADEFVKVMLHIYNRYKGVNVGIYSIQTTRRAGYFRF